MLSSSDFEKSNREENSEENLEMNNEIMSLKVDDENDQNINTEAVKEEGKYRVDVQKL